MRNSGLLLSTIIVLATTMLLFTGCGEDEAAPEITATVHGIVTDGVTNSPIAGATITYVQNTTSQTVTTDNAGMYIISGLDLGSHGLLTSKDGYTSMRDIVETAVDVVLTPVEFGLSFVNDVVLYPLGGTVTVQLGNNDKTVNYDGAKIAVSLNQYGVTAATMPTEGTAGSTGKAVITGLPAGILVYLRLLPFDENNDGKADYSSDQYSVKLTNIDEIHPLDIWPDQYTASGFDLLLTNVPPNRGDQLNDPVDLYLIFNQAVAVYASETWVTLFNNTRGVDENIVATWSEGNTKVTINSADKMERGESFTLDISAVSTDGDTYDGSFTFSIGQVDELVVSVASVSVDTTGPGTSKYPDFDDLDLWIEWPAVSGAASYVIYAHDNLNNPDWDQVGTKAANDLESIAQVDFTLPTQFDVYSGDHKGQTPFAAGTDVDVAVTTVSASGYETAVEVAPTVTFSDIVTPTKSGIGWSTPSGGNLFKQWFEDEDIDPVTGKRQITVTLTFSEYIDKTTNPVVTAKDGPDTNTVEPTISWEWDDNLYFGLLTIVEDTTGYAKETAANFKGTRDTLYVSYSTLKDGSGNVSEVTAQETVYLTQR